MSCDSPPPFTPEQEARIRALLREALAEALSAIARGGGGDAFRSAAWRLSPPANPPPSPPGGE